MNTPSQSDRLTAHNRGILAFLQSTSTAEPPQGNPGSVAAAFRAGWFSAKAAMADEGKR